MSSKTKNNKKSAKGSNNTSKTPAQTPDYIIHHLKLAGRSDTLFSDDAMALVHDTARGLPRAVNNIATQALVAAMAERKNIVDEQSARTAVSEITSD